MSTTTVIINAKFPQMKPAHHAFVTKTGTGSSYWRACKDAIDQMSKDERMKGKRVANLSPASMTISTYEAVESEED
jgi:hypothetical protein